MRARAITTWNVLHRVHARNWNERAIALHPDERVRVAAVARLVAARCTPGSAICLQEVSGDQLAALRAALPEGAALFLHPYPRTPHLRVPDAGLELDDPTEHLLVIAYEPARAAAARTFASDPGKGLLAVELDGGAVVCVHVSFGDKRRDQLREIEATVRALTGTVVVAGDFNATLAKVRDAWLPGAVYADLAGQPLRTRRGAGSAGDDVDIDHVAVLRGEIVEADVLEDGELSDHRPVTAVVRFR
jgi:endonuclease/exonuclease/phosphatase (EEP) superfamily protein YafD